MSGEYAWSRQQRGDCQEAIGLIQRFAIGARIRDNGDGTIETPAFLTLEPAGRAQRWREVGNFVWREVGGTARLVAAVEKGRVRSVWIDQAAAVWVNLPVSPLRSGWLNVPVLLGALVVLTAATLGWPIAAAIRRRRDPRRPVPVTTTLTRLAALLGVVALVGWGMAIAADLASKVGSEPWIRVIQLVTLAAALGATAAIADVRRGWPARGVAGRIGSVLVAFALVDLAWFAIAFRLLSISLD